MKNNNSYTFLYPTKMRKEVEKLTGLSKKWESTAILIREAIKEKIDNLIGINYPLYSPLWVLINELIEEVKNGNSKTSDLVKRPAEYVGITHTISTTPYRWMWAQ